MVDHTLLPPEVWAKILFHLKQPIPAPLSAPPRSALHQHDLTVVMRVSRLFRALGEPILYGGIMTDRLASILANPHLPSVRRRLAHITSLHIEYMAKGDDSPYSELFRGGEPAWTYLARPSQEGAVLVDCMRELLALGQSLQAVNRLGTLAVLPKLRRIAVGSIYGRGADDWLTYHMWHADRKQPSLPMVDCSRNWTLFMESLHLDALCVRDDDGPLSLPRMSLVSEHEGPRKGCEVSYHSPSRVHQLPLPLGHPMRWVSDAPTGTDWSVPLSIIAKTMINGIAYWREAIAHKSFPDKPDLDIYCSTSYGSSIHNIPDNERLGDLRLDKEYCGRDLTEGEQRAISAELGGAVDKLVGGAGWEPGVVRYKPSMDAPVCRACGSGAPGREQGTWVSGPYAIAPQGRVEA